MIEMSKSEEAKMYEEAKALIQYHTQRRHWYWKAYDWVRHVLHALQWARSEYLAAYRDRG